MKDLHTVHFVNLEFRENRCGLSDVSLKGVNEILPHIFCIIHSIWKKFDMRDAYLLSYTQFRKNRLSENHTLLTAQMNFYS